ncbi:hypothetical protein A8C32_17690 [Flavivirga aquatica]|uniref:EcxA zinc-binding domain-containing protein n=1 Tax=Flavivirga aquatica TaxID=1849968 RepID=A0A1E5T8B8_9FLAO|nr:hypothetical protein [Flavivirga aquatica]OEK07629.1 hypothetical protein A8C32_17690 [Flavivirga aquatica]
MRVEIIYLGLKVAPIKLSYEFYRKCDKKGKPKTMVLGGGVKVKLEANYETMRFLEEILSIDERYKNRDLTNPTDSESYKKVSINIYDDEDYNIRSLELLDSYISNFKEVFYTVKEHIKNEETNNFVKLEFKSASQIINKGEAVNVFGWWLTHPITNAPYKTPVNTVEEKETDLKFIANFERLSSYKGEFGFDWMRDEYKDICDNYEALKKEYNPTTINGKEYFVPWLSMFPKQNNVSLLLKVKQVKGNNGKVKKDDIVKLPTKHGIRFEPNEVRVKDIKENGVLINVFCDSPLSSDTEISLLNKNDATVGKIMFFKNDETRRFGVKFVKVLGNEEDNKYNNLTFNRLQPSWVNKTITAFNETYFNQALIQVKNDGIEEMIIDVDDYENRGVLEAFISDGKKGIPRYKNGFDEELYKQYVKNNGEYRGVIFFLSAFQQPDDRQGHAKLYPTELNYILMTPSSVGTSNLHSYAHELGHTLGLDHTWVTEEDNRKRLQEIEKYIEKNKANVKIYLDQYKDLPDSTPVKNSQKTLGDIRQETKEKLKVVLKDIENEKASRLKFVSKKTFNKATTDNIMDYPGYDLPDGTKIRNYFSGVSFWKWQWIIMRNEITAYYGE